MAVLHLLAGPNGAGKSSYVRDVLMPATHLPFINAGEIAAERWPDSPVEHAYEAARIAAAQRRERIGKADSFISETVFSHSNKVRLVADCVEAGYLVHLHVIMVPVDLAVQRVRERVRRGGHAVPEQKIRERYERLWEKRQVTGDFWTRGGLDRATRERLGLVTLTALGLVPQLPAHVRGCLAADNEVSTVLAVVMQAFPHVGYPSALNAIRVVLAEAAQPA